MQTNYPSHVAAEHKDSFDQWFEETTFEPIDTGSIREKVRHELSLLRSMSVKEYTLWSKWDEIRTEFSNASRSEIKKIRSVRSKIWHPKNFDDFYELKPELVFVKTQFPVTSVSIWGHETFEFFTNPDPIESDWQSLRVFVSTMPHGGNVGRSLRFLVRDSITKKYLGVICISSDFLELSGRDKLIGWTQKQKIDRQKLNHTAIGSVIIPTQPFGYNFVGGKLLALLCLSDVVSNLWESIYGDKLVGVSTTSLYGEQASGTQYDGLKYWKNCGTSTGMTAVKLSTETEKAVRHWLMNHHPYEYWLYYVATRPSGMPLITSSTARARTFAYSKLGFQKKEYESSHSRGIYFSKLYENADAYLRDEIDETQLVSKFNRSVSALTDLWMNRYATKRYEKLKLQNSLSHDGVFYDELLRLSWDQVKADYLRF